MGSHFLIEVTSHEGCVCFVVVSIVSELRWEVVLNRGLTVCFCHWSYFGLLAFSPNKMFPIATPISTNLSLVCIIKACEGSLRFVLRLECHLFVGYSILLSSTHPKRIQHHTMQKVYYYDSRFLFFLSFRDSNTLFRGNSIATKSVDEFMKHAGMHFLHDTIKCLVDEVRHFDLQIFYSIILSAFN